LDRQLRGMQLNFDTQLGRMQLRPGLEAGAAEVPVAKGATCPDASYSDALFASVTIVSDRLTDVRSVWAHVPSRAHFSSPVGTCKIAKGWIER
jgi:hypothetical protein